MTGGGAESAKRVPQGYVHEDTIRSLSMVWFAGMFIGSGATLLLVRGGYVALTWPVLEPAGAIAVGAFVTWLALKLLPDARTIAAQVEEREYFNE